MLLITSRGCFLIVRDCGKQDECKTKFMGPRGGILPGLLLYERRKQSEQKES